MDRVEEILIAVQAEIQESSRPTTLTVVERSEHQSIWTLRVDSHGKLNDTQEGWKAWWPSGSASVVSVVPDDNLIHLNFATNVPPSFGEILQLYPPRFLEQLQELWKRPWLAVEALSRLDSLESTDREYSQELIPTFPWLRKGQSEAFRLASRKCGYLWGPPGTGKTRTIGALLAQYLAQFPNARILLLSNTNSAVDQAILSVDGSVEELINRDVQSAPLRGQYLRMGVHFIANNYLGREHILPTTDSTILAELAQLEDERPSSNDARSYATWKDRVQAVRKRIPRRLTQARLIAITVSEAILKFDELRESGKFDLMIFDEASQIGRAQALALMPLSSSVIFGGDPKQLSPIVQSKEANYVPKWLGTSMFEHMRPDSDTTCFLSEQSRMVPKICRIVSKVFYDGKLIVASDCAKDSWRKERSPAYVDGYGESPVIVPEINTEGKYSQKYGGWIRHESATAIASIIGHMLTCLDMSEDKILILSPYHAQNLLIRQMVNGKGRRPIRVRTVHSAQGLECHTVFFDPVNGVEGLKHGLASARLINVAISRAQACLVVPLSSGDLNNSELGRIYECATGKKVPTVAVIGTSLYDLALRPGFPQSCLKELVALPQGNGEMLPGEIVEVAPDQSWFFVKPSGGDRTPKKFISSLVLNRARAI